MKILTVVGARPQFVKAAAVSRVLRENHTEVLVHTGQHYDERMSEVFFRELGIPEPDYNLEVGSAGHSVQTGEMLIRMEPIFEKEKPDWVLVYGDTNSTLAGALVAVKLHIPVAHVEAGLRSFNREMPEEINRVLTDHVSDMLFCPAQKAVDNLKLEGVTSGVHIVGDVMYDAVLRHSEAAEKHSSVLSTLGLESKNICLQLSIVLPMWTIHKNYSISLKPLPCLVRQWSFRFIRVHARRFTCQEFPLGKTSNWWSLLVISICCGWRRMPA